MNGVGGSSSWQDGWDPELTSSLAQLSLSFDKAAKAPASLSTSLPFSNETSKVP